MMKITNRKAFYDYQIQDSIEAGIQLTGVEVKAVKEGHADMTGSFVRIIGSEAYIVGMKIFPYKYSAPDDYDERRTRKLLLHKKQIISIKSRMEGSGLSAVPVSVYTKGNLVKLEVALGKGKKKYQKRQSLKRKDIKRETEREISS